MSTHRFYVHPKQIVDGNVFIRGTDVWHITRVLRLSKGAQVIVFDGTGREYQVVIGKRKPREVLGKVIKQWECHTESPLQLTLVQGVPKAKKMDLIIQKASEIGVHAIIPLQTERADIRVHSKHLSPDKIAQKLDRWARIGVEAAKQSHRTAIPKIEPFMSVQEFLAQRLATDVRLLLWEAEEEQNLKGVLRNHSGSVESAIVVIGPEGGFTRDEAEQFMTAGYDSVSLGKRILRTETAGMVVLGILQYEYGDY
jgi:16S rRNA (uracil1498-N3)-methyltransferase